MANSNIWIIQNDLEKLKKALNTIKNDSNNFLYTNCISHFKFDNVKMNSKNFNSFLYSEKSDTYIIFMKDSIEELDYAKKYLLINNIQYHEINLKNEDEDVINKFPHTLHNYGVNLQEIWIVNNEKKLLNLLNDTKYKKILAYPLIDANIRLTYSNNSDSEIELNNFKFSGVVVTTDKIILLSKSDNKKNMLNIKNILQKTGIKYVRIFDSKPHFINVEEKRNEKYNNEYMLKKSLGV